MDLLQRAMNAGVRAVVGLPRYGYAPISEITNKLGLPTASKIKDKIMLQAAWKRFHHQPPTFPDGPITRGRANANIPHANQKGHFGKTSGSLLIPYWNRLPLSTKLEPDVKKAKRNINTLLSN